MDTHRNPAPVVAHSDRSISVDFHIDMVGMTGQSLINAVVDDLINHVVQAGPIIGITDIHARPLANRL